MGCAPIAHTLWSEVMNYDPKNPKWVRLQGFVVMCSTTVIVSFCPMVMLALFFILCCILPDMMYPFFSLYDVNSSPWTT